MADQNSGCDVIFGATGGVGESLATRLKRSGRNIVLAGRDQQKLQDIAERLSAPSAIVEANEPATFQGALDHAVEKYGSVNGVANCIGSVLLKPAHITSDDEFWETVKVNLGSSFAILKASVKAMRKEGGSIVFVSTAAATLGMPSHEAIAAAKGGIVGMARAAAATYASKGIRVNVVAPGLVKTGMTESIWGNEKNAEASLAMHALGRFGEPEDISSCIDWLLDPNNSWVSGQVIGVDGGLGSLLPRARG